MRTAVLVMLIYAAADALPLDKELNTAGGGSVPEVKQKVTARSRLPYVGPKPFIKTESWDKAPAKAAPDKQPYFGKRPAAVPPVHFMSPKQAEEASHQVQVPAKPGQPVKKKLEKLDPPPPMPR
jgi:hypothetical protein